jgi:hypothetical protein
VFILKDLIDPFKNPFSPWYWLAAVQNIRQNTLNQDQQEDMIDEDEDEFDDYEDHEDYEELE